MCASVNRSGDVRILAGRGRPCDACHVDWPTWARWCGLCGSPLSEATVVMTRRRPVGRLAAVVAALLVLSLGVGGVGHLVARVTGSLVAGPADRTQVNLPQPAPDPSVAVPASPVSVLCDPPGCELWRFAAPGGLEVAVSQDRSSILATARPSGTIHVIDADSGEARWQREVAVNRHTQLLGETVLLWTDDELVALDLDGGEQRWNIPAPVIAHRPVYRLVRQAGSWVDGSRRVSDGWVTDGRDPVAVLVGYRGPADREILFALDLRTGDELWSHDDATASGLVGGRVVVVRDHRAVPSDPDPRRAAAVIDARTGAELWSQPLAGRGSWASPVGDDYVLVEDPGEQWLLDAGTGAPVVTVGAAGGDGSPADGSPTDGSPADGKAEHASAAGIAAPPAWWYAPEAAPVLVRIVEPSEEAAELVAHHLDGRELWRRSLPIARDSVRADACCVEVRDGPDGALVVRDGRAGPDALVVTLDVMSGETRRVSMRLDAAAALDPNGNGLPGSWWVAAHAPGRVAAQHPDTGELGWRLSTLGERGELRVVHADPLLVVGPGELLRLPSPTDAR